MSVPGERPVLHVEGRDDRHTIIQLLGRHGWSFDEPDRPVVIKAAGELEGLLRSIPVAVKASAMGAVGFVVDADIAVRDRWQQVVHRLRPLGIELPDNPPAEGFVGEVTSLLARVGVWIMPDNRTDFGQLEHLIKALVLVGDCLFPHAEQATDRARELGAAFSDVDRLKAVLHAWLAWQKRPGCPYGTAIKAHFLSHDSDNAKRFASWFNRLFGQAHAETRS
jgi:hypothetical protein